MVKVVDGVIGFFQLQHTSHLQELRNVTFGVQATLSTGNNAQKQADKVSKASAGKSDMVSAWLQRKAEEQRKAARDFLKKPEEILTVHSDVFADQGACSAIARCSSSEQQGNVLPAAGGVDTIVQEVAGGVVRGKVYSKKAL